eukprot:1818378-Rhodomonas_salina.1
MARRDFAAEKAWLPTHARPRVTARSLQLRRRGARVLTPRTERERERESERATERDTARETERGTERGTDRDRDSRLTSKICEPGTETCENMRV